MCNYLSKKKKTSVKIKGKKTGKTMVKAVSIWGWQDDPMLSEGSYGYSMNGPYCGLFTELYAVKDSFKNVYAVLK